MKIFCRRGTGDVGDATEDAGNFLERKFPAPFKELAGRLWE